MNSTIKPGQVVLVAALPLPMEGLSVLHAAVEALYGTGESMLDMSQGDAIRVTAPADGFGPRAHGAPQPFVDVTDGMKLRTVQIADETLTMTVEDAQATVAYLATAMSTWFTSVDAVNYITCEFVNPDQDNALFYITVQKAGNPTAHDLRLVAEQRVSELEAEVGNIRAQLKQRTRPPSKQQKFAPARDDGLKPCIQTSDSFNGPTEHVVWAADVSQARLIGYRKNRPVPDARRAAASELEESGE